MATEYIVDQSGNRRSVVLPIEEYERLRTAAEENEKMARYPGVSFEGTGGSRRATLARSVFDVWEVVALYRSKGRQRLFSEHPVSEEQLALALSYYEAYPKEVDAVIEENDQPLAYWRKKYPEIEITSTGL